MFEECVESCADSLYRVAFRLTADSTLATELVQETYLNAWKNLASLESEQKMRSWMFAIMRNQYSKQMRDESKLRKSVQAAQSSSVRPAEQSPDLLADREAVQRGIDTLEEKYKFPLLLVAMEGVSVEEAADVLQIPRGTVLSRLHRGREQLKQFLVRQGFDLPPGAEAAQAT